MLASAVDWMGGPHVDGGLREFAVLPAAYLHPGGALTFDHLALVEPLAIGAHAVAGAKIAKSVDETETPTTHAEHVYFASELRRLGVRWVSLAPRYVRRFEKGVDYTGGHAGCSNSPAA